MASSESLTAAQLHAAFRVAEQWFVLNRDGLNAINVYPVPDGDTGTNMLLTLRASLAAAGQAGGTAVGPYTQALSRGALLGARGNSGVILSQILRGFAEELAEDETLDGPKLCAALDHAFDLVVANPPYVAQRSFPALAPEITAFEPATALLAGTDGLACYREIVPALPRLLGAGGLAVLEIGDRQAASVARLLSEAEMRPIAVARDLAHHPRCIVATRSSS